MADCGEFAQPGDSIKPLPIFLMSLPRSGSTLLQRLIAAHPQIATTSEPWVLLPVLSALRYSSSYADYSHSDASAAIADFCASLPSGDQSYFEAVRTFALELYAHASPRDAMYFLDKTPRYHLIAEELSRTFPDAKYVFLWRHPLSIVAS